MTTFANVTNNEIVVNAAQLVAPAVPATIEWNMLTHEHAEYPQLVYVQYGPNSRNIWALGNLDLLKNKLYTVITSTHTSETNRVKVARIVRVIAEAHRRKGLDAPTFLFASEQNIDFGLTNTNEETGEVKVLFKGLVNVALEEGCNVVVFKAGRVLPQSLENRDWNSMCILNVVDPTPRVRDAWDEGEEDNFARGNVSMAHVRNAYVACLSEMIFAGEIAQNGGVRDILNKAGRLGVLRFVFPFEKGTVPVKGKDGKVTRRSITLAATEMIELEGCESIDSPAQIANLF